MRFVAVRAALVGLVLVVAAVVIGPNRGADAKATQFVRRVFDFEAVVTKVTVSDNPGDADFNFQLRPVDPTVDTGLLAPEVIQRAPESTARYLYESWHPHATDWVWAQSWQDNLRFWFAGGFTLQPLRRSMLSEQCRQCAGLPNDDAPICEVTDGEAHSCPELFSCRDCLYDMSRLTGENLNRFVIEAELFFGDEWDDLNVQTLITGRALNIGWWGLASGSASGGDACVERGWDPVRGEWYNTAPADSICGKRVLISGWATAEEMHQAKPEIHPISSIIVDWTYGSDAGLYTVGAFIDGSHDGPGIWQFNYRDHFDPRDYPYTYQRPDRVELDLAGLQGEPPRAGSVGSPLSGATEYWTSECRVEPDVVFNTPHVEQVPHNGRCPTLLIGMNRDDPRGAAWIAQVHEQWSQSGFSLKLAATLDTPGGTLPVGPPPPLPGQSPAVQLQVTGIAGPTAQAAPAAGATQLMTMLPLAACAITPELPRKPFEPAPPLRRWYTWTLDITGEKPLGVVPELRLESIPSGAVSFGTVQDVPDIEQATFHRRVPLTMGVSERSPLYSAQVRVALAATSVATSKTEEFAWDTIQLVAPPPNVRLETRNPRVEPSAAGPVYVVDVDAAAGGFCGEIERLKYEWRSHGGSETLAAVVPTKAQASGKVPLFTTPSAPAAQGPHFQLSLRPGEAKTVAVVVSDEWGVERAVGAEVITAPLLAAQLDVGCGDGRPGAQEVRPELARGADSSFSPLPERPGLPGSGQGGVRYCRELWLVARAGERGYGATFPTALNGLHYEWRDLMYQSAATGWQWEDIPDSWLGSPTTRDERITVRSVLPGTAEFGFYRFQASVTVTDALGRTATANLTGTNDVSAPTAVRKELETLWRSARPGAPLPLPDPCGGDCASTRPPADPLRAEFAGLLHQVDRTKGDYRSMLWLRSHLDALRQLVMAVETGDPRLSDAGHPVFSTPATTFAHPKDLRERALVETASALGLAASRQQAESSSLVARAGAESGAGLRIALAPGVAAAVAGAGASLIPAQVGAQSGIGVDPNTDRPGSDYRSFEVPGGLDDCRRTCEDDPQCRAFTFVRPGVQAQSGVCWLKSDIPAARPDDCCTSGAKLGAQTQVAGAVTRELDTDRPGMDYDAFEVASVDACADRCSQDARCQAYTSVVVDRSGRLHCYLKSGVPAPRHDERCVSGVRTGAPAAAAGTGMVTAAPTLLVAAPQAVTAATTVEERTNRSGGDYRRFEAPGGLDECRRACDDDAACQAYTFVRPGIQSPDGMCWLKSSVPEPAADDCCTSGVKGATPAPSESRAAATRCTVESATDRPGGDYRRFEVAGGFEQCLQACIEDPACTAYTFVRPGIQAANGMCWLKSSSGEPRRDACCVSGVKVHD